MARSHVYVGFGVMARPFRAFPLVTFSKNERGKMFESVQLLFGLDKPTIRLVGLLYNCVFVCIGYTHTHVSINESYIGAHLGPDQQKE